MDFAFSWDAFLLSAPASHKFVRCFKPVTFCCCWFNWKSTESFLKGTWTAVVWLEAQGTMGMILLIYCLHAFRVRAGTPKSHQGISENTVPSTVGEVFRVLGIWKALTAIKTSHIRNVGSCEPVLVISRWPLKFSNNFLSPHLFSLPRDGASLCRLGEPGSDISLETCCFSWEVEDLLC